MITSTPESRAEFAKEIGEFSTKDAIDPHTNLLLVGGRICGYLQAHGEREVGEAFLEFLQITAPQLEKRQR